MIGEAVRSGARGEFGALVPVRPVVGEIDRCLRGHWLNLDLYDKLAPFSHRYRLHGWLCEVCRGLEACEPDARRLAEWALLDVTVQHAPDAAPNSGLVLAAHPPAAETLAGRVELRLDGGEVGSVTASPCGRCRTATLDYVHVAAEYRCLGLGRTLVAAAVARAPSYRWTAPLPDGPVAQSFRARIAMRRAGPAARRAGACREGSSSRWPTTSGARLGRPTAVGGEVRARRHIGGRCAAEPGLGMIGTVGGRAGPITSASNEKAFGGHNDVRRWRSPRRVTRWCPGRGGVLARNLPGIRRHPAVRVAIGGDASADLSLRKPDIAD
ncbi:GNAT family N-acetyltransferase [Amycolatopsis sp. NPDC101161]|uniref:GNAT family N-acetyltransferase n=1 Tax=Amycolatopsis sp. NPDC101161 TaxID=3363940 RepID=UPI0038143D77